MRIAQLAIATLILTLPVAVYAGPGTSLPEPETLALLGVGAIALIIVRWRKRK